MHASTHKVKNLVSDIRRRWRRRALMQGAALTLLVLLFCATALLLAYTTARVQPLHLMLGLGVTALVVLAVAVQFLLRPALRRLSDRQIALFVEEKIPDLEDRLNSAVEVDDAARLRREHGALIDRLIDDAARRTRAIPLTTLVDRKRERVLAYSAGAGLVLFLLFGYTSLDKISLRQIDLAALAQPAQPYLSVSPGNLEIEKGASQEILATLREAPGRDVMLVYKEGEGAWQQAPMRAGLGQPVYLLELPNIQAPVQYYVEVGERRSEPYLLSLYAFPDVERIDVTYRFPAYTGLPPRTEEDTGDVRGLKGSTVTLDVHTTGTVAAAELMLDDAQRIPLKAAGGGVFRGTLILQDPHLYVVRLQDEQARENKFPDEYQIVPVEDEQPLITITDPQRDVRANALEEVLVAATAQDDFGLKDLRLKFSVNGEAEQAVGLMDAAAQRQPEASGEHLFFLEDYGLQPGDVVSYYLEAEDFFHAAPEATDMYFIEVLPFDQKFSQANNMGGMQGQQPSGLVLSQQQIIAATWKLHRERAEMETAEVEEARQALVQAQANLKGNIEERINATAFSLELRGDETNQQIVAYLRQAVAEMGKAVLDLEADRLKAALTPERKALNHLLKADALNKERQVAMNRGGQGGGQSATEERMTELMDLELDISKDKYEMQQQRQQRQQERQMDEALEKVRELARKQQNLANQQRLDELQGEDKKRFIDKLKRDQEELRQQTERLASAMQQNAREQGGLSREAQERLERVADNMREAERALRRDEVQKALTRQQQALNELRQLQRDLQLAANDNTRGAVEDLARQFDQFRDQERRLGDDLARAERDARARGGQADEQTLGRLQQQRQQTIDNLEQLESQARAVQERIRQEDPELATAIRNMLQQMQRERLEEKMLNSEDAIEQGWLDYAERLEEEILAALDKLETQRRAFERSLPVAEEEHLARALEDVRDLMRQLQEMQARAQGQQSGQSGQNADREARAEAARAQRQMERARENLERLQRGLGGNPTAQRQLRQIESFLNRADHTGVMLEGEAAKAFFNDRVFDPLAQLEMEIARQLDLIAMEKKLYGGRDADVPSEYRDLVEKYYEALAKTRNR